MNETDPETIEINEYDGVSLYDALSGSDADDDGCHSSGEEFEDGWGGWRMMEEDTSAFLSNSIL